MAALTPKSLNFTAPLLSDGELKRDDLQIDIQRYIDALKVRSNILDANHSLARMMGETLKTNSIAENMQRDVFEGLNPQFLDLDGNNLDTVINWVDLIQEVPVAQFHPVSKPGSDDHSDQALMYQCQLETGIVQLTDKQLNLFRFLQNDCSRPSVFEEDIKKEEDIVAAEATRCEEILETLASKQRLSGYQS